MYSGTTETRIPFTRVEQSHITGLSPNALRVYATTRSFANGHGKVTQVYQDQMAVRAGLGRTRYLQGLREAEEAGAVVTDYDRLRHNTTYTFPKSGARFAAIPNPVLVRALKELTARDLQVLIACYSYVDSRTGITWISGSDLAGELGTAKSSVFRALRRIRDAGLARRCTDRACSKGDHWHLPTHQACTVCSAAGGCNMADVACPLGVTQGVPIANMVKEAQVTDDELRIVGREDHRERKRRPQSRTLRAQQGDDLPPKGADIWGNTEPDPVAKQTVLAKELLAAIATIKPGVLWKGPDYSMMTKWFRERLDHGWTEETCRRAITMFIEDPGTVLAIGEKRPTVAFMGFVRKREAQFSETVTKQLREVQDDYQNARRRVAEARRQALANASRQADPK